MVKPDSDGWAGNYPVAYWDARWKEIAIHGAPGAESGGKERGYNSIIDETLRDGFDGVYLDWVEGYADEGVIAAAKAAQVDPAKEMAKFVAEIRAYTRKREPGFLIIAQNGARLIEEQPRFVDAIDAIAQEHIWFKGGADVDWANSSGYDQRSDSADTEGLLVALKSYQRAGKPVFNIEYALKNAPLAYKRSLECGFVPYCSRSSLSELTSTPHPDY